MDVFRTSLVSRSGGIGHEPFGIAKGDFDGDGSLDLAVTSILDNSVQLLRGNGDGTFTSVNTIGLGGSPRDVVVGDWDGNGTADLAIVNQTGDGVSILLNLAHSNSPQSPMRVARIRYWKVSQCCWMRALAPIQTTIPLLIVGI